MSCNAKFKCVGRLYAPDESIRKSQVQTPQLHLGRKICLPPLAWISIWTSKGAPVTQVIPLHLQSFSVAPRDSVTGQTGGRGSGSGSNVGVAESGEVSYLLYTRGSSPAEHPVPEDISFTFELWWWAGPPRTYSTRSMSLLPDLSDFEPPFFWEHLAILNLRQASM